MSSFVVVVVNRSRGVVVRVCRAPQERCVNPFRTGGRGPTSDLIPSAVVCLATDRVDDDAIAALRFAVETALGVLQLLKRAHERSASLVNRCRHPLVLCASE